MTEHDRNDRSDSTGRRDEIEITEEMLKAGAEALALWVSDDAETVASIAYEAMEIVRRRGLGARGS